MNETLCPVCNANARVKRVSKAFGQGSELLVIEDIPVIVCRVCHEQYITAETLEEIERLRSQRSHGSRVVAVEHCTA